MQLESITRVRKPSSRTHGLGCKPFTETELLAKSHAEFCLQLAKLYADECITSTAASCCLAGLLAIDGVSRPFAVRDQLDDLLKTLHPSTFARDQQ